MRGKAVGGGRVDHQLAVRAEVETVALPVHHHGVGHIWQTHGSTGGAGEQFDRGKVLRLARGAEPGEITCGAGDDDVDGVGGNGQTSAVQADLVDRRGIATRRLAHGIYRSRTGESGGDGAAGAGGDVDGVGGLVSERKAMLDRGYASMLVS